ncbi:MAG: exodeoxyribonuclease VII large subunit [Oscillospiraceae bacterium]|nr:exodeoxyribonuclease VII large subunit [Oscillospiraceae bacterium]
MRDVLVRGEASNYKVYPSGHHYFTLKDAEGTLKCVMFRNAAASLSFRPADGMRLLASGQVSVYPRDGVYQLYCRHLLPDGEGALTRAFEELKNRLAEEGLFDPAHKKPLPPYPARVALVTSPAGAAVRDMIRIFGRRFPLCEILVAPVRVQGEEAPEEIARAIRYVSRHALADVMIVGRGGGSLEDLWAFNDERVARAIFASSVPVVSAVGHEPDVLISDFAADARASTPSHAAELVSPDAADLLARVAQSAARLTFAQKRRLETLARALERRRGALKTPERLLRDKLQRLDSARARLDALAERALRDAARAAALRAARLDALSPLKVLGRGYAIAYTEAGAALKDAGTLSAGDTLTIRPEKGRAVCQVITAE